MKALIIEAREKGHGNPSFYQQILGGIRALAGAHNLRTVLYGRAWRLIWQIAQPIISCQLRLYRVFIYLGNMANLINSGLI